MKFTTSIAFTALTVAATSPLISAAPFPSSPNHAGSDSPIIRSPQPDEAMSPRMRPSEKFGGQSALGRRASGVGARTQGKRQLSGASLPVPQPLNGLGLGLGSLQGTPSGAQQQATGALGGLGLGSLGGTLQQAQGQAQGLGLGLGSLNGVQQTVNSQLGGLGVNQIVAEISALEGQLPTNVLNGLGLGSLQNTVQGLTGNIGSLPSQLVQSAQGTVNSGLGLVDGLVSGLPLVGGTAGSLLNNVDGTVNGVLNQATGLTGQLGGTVNGVLNQATGQIGGAVSQVHNIAGGLQGQLGGVTGQLGGLTGQLSGVTGQLGGVTGQLNGLTGQLGGATGQLGGVQGQINGLTGQLGAATGQFPTANTKLSQSSQYANIPSSLGQYAGAVPDIDPSLVTGQLHPASLTNAIDSTSDSVQADALDPATGVLPNQLSNPRDTLHSLDSTVNQAEGTLDSTPGVGGALGTSDDVVGSAAPLWDTIPSIHSTASDAWASAVAAPVASAVAGSPAYPYQQAAGSAWAGLRGPINSLSSELPVPTGHLQGDLNAVQYAPDYLLGNYNPIPPVYYPQVKQLDVQRVDPAASAENAAASAPADVDDLPNPYSVAPSEAAAKDDSQQAAYTLQSQINADVNGAETSIFNEVLPTGTSSASDSSASTSPTPAAATTASENPLLSLQPPLTAEPTAEPYYTDVNYYYTGSAIPTTTGAANYNQTAPAFTPGASADATSSITDSSSPSSSAVTDSSAPGSAAPTAAPTVPARRRKRAALAANVPNAAQAQAPSDASDVDGSTVEDESNSGLHPLAPQAAPFLAQYVAMYSAPVSIASPLPSPAAPFYTSLSSLDDEPSLPVPTLTFTDADAEATPTMASVAAFSSAALVKAVQQSASSANASPSPYANWSQDTNYPKHNDEGAASSSSDAKGMNTKGPLAQADDELAAIRNNNNNRKRQEAPSASQPKPTHAQQPPSNWSQDTTFSAHHKAPKASGSGKPEPAVKAADLVPRNHDSSKGRDVREEAREQHRASRAAKGPTVTHTIYVTSGKGGRPPLSRNTAYNHKTDKPLMSTNAPSAPVPTASVVPSAPINHAPAPLSPPASVASNAPHAASAGGAPARIQMVRFARYRRDASDVVAPPAGEHGEPDMPDATTSDPPAYDEAEASSTATPSSAPTTTHKPKKSGTSKLMSWTKGSKSGKGKKTDSAAQATETAQSSEESADKPDSKVKWSAKFKRSFSADGKLRNWL